MASQLDDIARISQDIAIQSKVKSLEVGDGLHTNYDLQLEKNENHLANLKAMLLKLQGQSHFLDNLAKENLSATSGIEITDHQEILREEKNKDKKEIKQLENDIGSLADTLCTKHNVLKEKLQTLEEKLSSTKDKERSLEIMKQKLGKMEEKVELEKNGDLLKELKAKQQETAVVIEECKTSISSLEHCKALLQDEISRLQDFANETTQDFIKQQAMKQKNQQLEGAIRQWFAEATELYSTLGGIHVQSIQRDCVVLEIPSDAQPGLGEPGTPLILTIKFKLEGGRQAVFAGAKVNLDFLAVEDLISRTVETNDVVGFILQVKELFRKQRSLVMEIKELQANYAMDWEPNHGRIRVMLGKSGKVVCTLKVDPMCSHGLGQVQLLAVEGSSDHRGIQQLQSSGATRSLTAWIKNLQELFSIQ